MYQVNLGNDLLLTFALVQEAGQAINLTEAQDLAVTLKHETCSVTLNPAYIINEAGALQIEFNAPDQRLGVWALSVEGNLRDTRFADGLRAFRKDIYPAVKVLQPHQTANPPETLTAVLSAIVRGPQGIPGTPGDPTELLETLSQQQTRQIGEVAARLSSEQANALALQSDRLSREQADALDQQAERLSSEQADALDQQAERLSSEQRQQVASSMGNIYSEQENKLEDMRLKNQEAVDSLATLRQEQSQFLFDFSQEQQQKVDNALEQIPEQVEEQLPAQVESRLPDLVDGRLPDVVDGKLPPLVDERIAGAVETAMPNQLTTALPPVVASGLPSEVERQLPPLVHPAVQELVTGEMVSEVVTQAGKLIGHIGGRNLVLRSDKQPPRLTPTYAVALFRISKPWVAWGKYVLSACISIKTDNPDPKYYIFSNWGYRSVTPLTGGAHSVSADGWVTSTYRGIALAIDPRAIIEQHRDYLSIYCYAYNGSKEYETRVHWIKLEEGTVATEWTPAPEDTYANLAEERLTILESDRSQLWAQYGKILPNSSLSSEVQSVVQRLWTNYDGAYKRLRAAQQEVVNQPSEEAYTALSSLSNQYQTAASDLQAGLTEAMLTIASNMVGVLAKRIEALEGSSNG